MKPRLCSSRRCHPAEKKKSPHPHRPPLLFLAGQEVTLGTVRCHGDLPWPPTCRRCCAEATCLFRVSSLCWSVVKRFNPSVSCGAAATSCLCHAQPGRGRLGNTSRQGRAVGAVLSFDAILHDSNTCRSPDGYRSVVLRCRRASSRNLQTFTSNLRRHQLACVPHS